MTILSSTSPNIAISIIDGRLQVESANFTWTEPDLKICLFGNIKQKVSDTLKKCWKNKLIEPNWKVVHSYLFFNYIEKKRIDFRQI